MQTKDCLDWKEFKSCLEIIQAEVRAAKCKALPGIVFPELLYRGHADTSWKLQTTLERSGDFFGDFYNYYRLINRVKSEVETYFEKKWKIPSLSSVSAALGGDDIKSIASLISNSDQLYEYMVFLRHYGFPSPLLDWSRSPYVAAFFATRGFLINEVKAFSIFVFLDNVGQGKQYSAKAEDGISRIETLGPNVKGQKRHFLQQCEYTICTNRNSRFICHEDIVGPSNIIKFSPTLREQDILFKFNIPISESLAVREELNAWNLNSFSLFSSDDSFMEAIAAREIIKKG